MKAYSHNYKFINHLVYVQAYLYCIVLLFCQIFT